MEHAVTTQTAPPPELVEHEPATPRAPRQLSPRARKALLTAHIVCSVSLLGDSAGFLAAVFARRHSTTPRSSATTLKTLNMFSLVFGIIALSEALVTGVALGIGTRWGVFRYPWVTLTNSVLVVTVLLAGALVVEPPSDEMLNG